MTFNPTPEIIEDIRLGRMVILVDDEGRENEGDLIIAASLIRPEDINFMARYGRGLICLTLNAERCEQLHLPLMVGDNREANGTQFTISIDAAEGITTGISAADRATTIQTTMAVDSQPQDLAQPGHIFPLIAEPGGVLTRAGHTEAGVDLARLAGLEAGAVIVEVLNEDGSMARRPDLEHFAAEHDLKIGTIADLIEYRLRNEKTVRRVGDFALPTVHGEFRGVAYEDTVDGHIHLAMVKGEIDPAEPTLIRVHVQDSLSDLPGSCRADCGWPLDSAIKRVAEEGKGVVVIIRRDESSEELVHRITQFEDHDQDAQNLPSHSYDNVRTFGVGSQILLDLGACRMRILSAPKNLAGISGFGLEIVEYVSQNSPEETDS